MKKAYDEKKVFTCVNAEKAPLGMFGYFADDIYSLKRSVIEGQTNRRTIYNKLEGVLSSTVSKRFYTDNCGFKFALFYPMDERCNPQRY